MSNVSDQYVRLLYKRYKHFAAWLPNSTIRLGDVGVIEGNYFKRKTSLKGLGVKFIPRLGKKRLSFNDDLTSGLEVTATAAGDLGVARALPRAQTSVTIDFAKQGAFLFHAVDCYADEIEDKVAVGQALIRLGKKWDLNWSVVDTVVRAGSSTVLISNSRNAKLELKSKVDVDVSNLANPELGLKVTTKRGEVTVFLGQHDLTPLFRLSRFHRSWIEWLSGKSDTLHFGGPSSRRRLPRVPIFEAARPDSL